MAIAQEQQAWPFLPESFITARTVIDGSSPVIPIPGECSSDARPTSHQESHVTDTEVGVFLSRGKGPEQQELLRLIGTLVDETADGQKPALLRQNGGGVQCEVGTGLAHSARWRACCRTSGDGSVVNIERHHHTVLSVSPHWVRAGHGI
jgi:hypothetical protein